MDKRKRILVVDDEERHRELLEAMLESLGYDSELASNGTEALAKLDSRIDLVLLDVLMPVMNGLETAKQIRASKEYCDLPIVMVTVLDSKKDRLRAVESGANDFISKPIDKVELSVRIASLVKMKEAQDTIKRHGRESEERFRAIFQTAQDCIFMKDRTLAYTHANPAMLTLMGLVESQVIGKTNEKLFRPEYARYAKDLESRVLKGETIETEETLNCKGPSTTFNVLRFPMTDSAGDTIGVCGIARDVTERRQREGGSQVEADRYPSSAMKETLMQARRAAQSESIVLFLGESGSGKDYLARYLHDHSNRAGGPFFAVNCAALAPELAESELFGHEPGAFTGSQGRKRGLLELAEGGTLLLNEVGELPPKLQSKLLTFLDTNSFVRVGGEKNVVVNARLIAATNRDLEKEVRLGNFREDLYYRLNVFCIRVPPLRVHMEDLPLLLEEMLLSLSGKMGLARAPRIDAEAMDILVNYSWPGNVREVRNVLERALILCDRRSIRTKDVSITGKAYTEPVNADEISLSLRISQGASMHQALLEAKRRLIEAALARSSGSIKNAAMLLGISRDSFVHHMRSLDIRR